MEKEKKGKRERERKGRRELMARHFEAAVDAASSQQSSGDCKLPQPGSVLAVTLLWAHSDVVAATTKSPCVHWVISLPMIGSLAGQILHRRRKRLLASDLASRRKFVPLDFKQKK